MVPVEIINQFRRIRLRCFKVGWTIPYNPRVYYIRFIYEVNNHSAVNDYSRCLVVESLSLIWSLNCWERRVRFCNFWMTCRCNVFPLENVKRLTIFESNMWLRSKKMQSHDVLNQGSANQLLQGKVVEETFLESKVLGCHVGDPSWEVTSEVTLTLRLRKS